MKLERGGPNAFVEVELGRGESGGDGGAQQGKKLIWGLFLIAIGAAFLLDRVGVLDMPNIRRLWPAVFFVIGLAHMVDRRPGSGITFILMGGWFFACNEEWMGLEYWNAWPLLLVAIGIGIVIRALTREDARKRSPGGAS